MNKLPYVFYIAAVVCYVVALILIFQVHGSWWISAILLGCCLYLASLTEKYRRKSKQAKK